jgi:titin
VQGNYIGTDITGAVKLPNTIGVHIAGGAGRNVIGGTTTAARNIISGNSWAGVALYDFGTKGNIVQGNYVGTDVSGAFALGNARVGVHITEDAQENLIGGVEEGAGNLISGNDALGVCLCKRVKNNKVQGNRIGTNAEGTVAVPNNSGIAIREGSSRNLIGGTLAGAGNLVSGNKGNALALSEPGTVNNAIQGNIIGLNVTASAPLGNRLGLAILSGASSNRVGGAESGAANIIAGNHESGIVLIDANTQKNLVQGNFIGTNSKMARLVNEDRGIRIADGAHDNIVGGTKSSEANTILANKGAILISGDKTTGNLTEGNTLESAVVGNWRSGQTKNEFTPMEWDVTRFIKEVKALGEQAADNHNADYVFRFQYTGGNHRLDIEWAELWVNGKLLSRDTHRGSTGNANENNEYRFSIPVPDPQATYVLRANILSGGDSNGEIQLSRKSREPK